MSAPLPPGHTRRRDPEPLEIRVERVAIAIYEADPESYFNDGDDVLWEDNYANKGRYRDMAKAAIAALDAEADRG